MKTTILPTINNNNSNDSNNQKKVMDNADLTVVNPKVAIFDYGAGNLFSLKAALERNGARGASVVRDMKSLFLFDGLILPGVGNFDPAITSLGQEKGFLSSAIKSKMPILGICLGMEMLFNCSEEGKMDGLKIVDGEVRMLDKKKVKVPHMGWNNIQLVGQKISSENMIKRKNHIGGNGNSGSGSSSRLLRNIKDNSWVYFVHSYRIFPGKRARQIVVAATKYGDNKMPAVIEKGNIFGTQFHPEKSGPVGSQIIRNFLEICSSNGAIINASE
jgi:imidazole glycerol-phosphate synthase subunit HisH